MRDLVMNKDFMILAIVGGLSSGIYSAWSTLLDVILAPLGYTQVENQKGSINFSRVKLRGLV
jgi:hypothetical protein